MRLTDIAPQFLLDELLSLAKHDRDWVKWEPLTGGKYSASCGIKTWVRKMWQSGADAFNMWAVSNWLLDGPKVFKPSASQCQALEQVDVNLMLEDYAQPYPALMVMLDYPPFWCVLCHRTEKLLTCCLLSRDHANDITTTVAQTTDFVEVSLERFDKDCGDIQQQAGKALRVACNSCLALTNYEHRLDHLYPKEVASDLSLAREQTERGVRARNRIKLVVQVASFCQEIVLHKTERREYATAGEATGRTMPVHWRRGHWAMQPYGPKHSLRKRILRPAVLIHDELFVGDRSNTFATYK